MTKTTCNVKGCNALRYQNYKYCEWHCSYIAMGFSVEIEEEKKEPKKRRKIFRIKMKELG